MHNSFTDAITIGELIKNSRIEKRISVQDLSARTKIRVDQIINLENNNFSRLPGRIYLLGFIKSIALCLNIEREKALSIFEETYAKFLEDQKQGSDKCESDVAKTVSCKIPNTSENKRTHLSTFLLGIAASICLLIIGLAFFLKNEVVVNKTEVTEKQVEVEKKPKVEKRSVHNSVEKIIELSILAKTGKSWMAYKVDQKPIVQFTLMQGKSISFRGKTIKILIGNYHSLEIKKNNKLFVVDNVNLDHTLNLVFPETLREEKADPLFVKTQEKSKENNLSLN